MQIVVQKLSRYDPIALCLCSIQGHVLDYHRGSGPMACRLFHQFFSMSGECDICPLGLQYPNNVGFAAVYNRSLARRSIVMTLSKAMAIVIIVVTTETSSPTGIPDGYVFGAKEMTNR